MIWILRSVACEVKRFREWRDVLWHERGIIQEEIWSMCPDSRDINASASGAG